MRLDPEIIVAGEIRDPSTARVSIIAANTTWGTLHTNGAVSIPNRLQELEVEPYRV